MERRPHSGRVLVLIGIGLVAGVITGLSPCVLPVLPGVLASSALPTGTMSDAAPLAPDRRRPYLVILGLVGTFALLTLFAAWLVSLLGLPPGLLRGIGIAALIVVGLGLLIPPLGRLVERPFAGVGRVQPRRDASAIGFGAMLGLVFVPCAGPVLAAIAVVAASQSTSVELLALTTAFAVGIAVPLLVIALLGQQAVQRIRGLRERLPVVRQVAGGVLLATGVAIALGWTDRAALLVPDYVAAVQANVEDSDAAAQALADVTGAADQQSVAAPAGDVVAMAEDASVLGPRMDFNACEADPSQLANCGPARRFVGIDTWLNSKTNLTMDELRGDVVLVDFWTFGCINCQRTQPHLNEWNAKYGDQGLRIIGVHSPEFDYEKDIGNVSSALRDQGITYPVAIDNDFRTWREWSQRYWPARYLIDRNGVVRLVHYGEGAYDATERAIQQLLAQPVA